MVLLRVVKEVNGSGLQGSCFVFRSRLLQSFLRVRQRGLVLYGFTGFRRKRVLRNLGVSGFPGDLNWL